MRIMTRRNLFALVTLIALLALAAPAQALDIVFPPGSRVGLAPPPGTTPSRNFPGFEDAANKVAVIIATLPPEAYAELERSTSAEELKKRGLTLEQREDQGAAPGKGFLVIARQEAEGLKLRKWVFAIAAPDLTALVTVQIPDEAAKTYPDLVIRTALSTLTVRAAVPDEEQLALVPFRVGELAGFHIGGVMAGRAIMLTDAKPDAPGTDVDPHIIVAIAPGGPAQGANRDDFARNVFATIPNITNWRITTSEPMRISGQQGHQIMAAGKDGRSGSAISIVQWLRFGGGAYMHMIGVARTEAWTPAYARFRQVRDGIETR
jgi:hypothetical protein